MTGGVNNNINKPQVTTDLNTIKKHEGTTDKRPTISIFSSYDKDKSQSVDYKEANSFNLFGQARVNDQSGGGIVDQFGDGSLQNRVKSIAINNFSSKMGNMFKDSLKDFMVNNLFKKAENIDSNNKNDTITQYRQELDSRVKTDAKSKTQAANDILQKAYNEALIEALKEANANKEAGTGDDAINPNDMQDKLSGKNKQEKDGIKDNNILSEKVYSTYDADMSSKVSAAEAHILDINIDNYITKEMSGNLKNAAVEDLRTLYSIKKEEFNIDATPTEVNGKDEKQLQNKIKKAAKQLDKTVEQGIKSFQRGLDRDLRQQVNTTIDSLAGGADGLNNRQRPISATDPSNGKKITIVNGNATYAGGTNTTFKPNDKGGGELLTTITKQEGGKDVQYKLSMRIDKNGDVTNRIEVKDSVKDETALALSRQVDSNGGKEDAKAVTVDGDGNVKNKGEGENNIAGDALDKVIDSLFDKFTTNGKVSDNLDDEDYDPQKDKDNGIDQDQFNDYKQLGFSALAARVFAQQDDQNNSFALVGYDKSNGKLDNIQVTRTYENGKGTTTTTLKFNSVDELNRWIAKAYKDKTRTKA